MDKSEIGTSKLYIYTAIASLVLLSVYCCYRFIKYYDGSIPNNFNLLGLIIFATSTIFLILLFCKFNIKHRSTFFILFSVLTLSAIFSYDIIVPSICSDCQANALVGERFQEQGATKFLENYHKPTLYKFKNSPLLHKKLSEHYGNVIFNYERLLDNIENEAPDIINVSGGINWRIGKHSPLLFSLIGLWKTVSPKDYFSSVILLSNLLAIFYLISLYVFLGLFFKKEEYRSKLSIIFLILLLPVFLDQALETNNDLFLGTVVTWLLYFLIRNDTVKINWFDLLVGFILSLALLVKFTALMLFLPVFLFYVTKYELKAISKLLVVFLCFLVIPLLLYALFEYDVILNIITSHIENVVYNVGKGDSMTSIIYSVLYNGLFYFGIPWILMLVTHRFIPMRFPDRNEELTSFMFTDYFLLMGVIFWANGLARFWIGFLPLTIPLLAYIYQNCTEKRKMFLSISILLIINNILVLIHEGIILAGHYQKYFNLTYWN